MTRAVIVILGSLLLASCTQRMICPAYQSAFIYDKDELRKKFSYFLEDSTPKVLSASKNKYLVAEPVSYQRKVRSLQTVAMKPVAVDVPDSLLHEDSVSMADLDRAARSVIDSTFIVDVPSDTVSARADSVYVITKDKEVRLLKYNAPDSLVYDPVKDRYVGQRPRYYIDEVGYNLEQDSYMWYLRDAIVLPDVRLAKMQQSGGRDGKESAAGPKKKTSGGFFRNLFKKKPKSDSTQVQPPANPDEFDYVNPDTVAQDDPSLQGTQRKGLFARKRAAKASNGSKPVKDEAKTPDKKKEDEDDGF